MKGSSVFHPAPVAVIPQVAMRAPQPPDLARSKHFTLTLDTPGLVTMGHPEAEEDANRKQNRSAFFLVVDNIFWLFSQI